jgi:hypothetical protein
MQVNALVRSARRATSWEAIEVLAFADFPLGRLEVSAIFGGMVPHGSRSWRSPQKVRTMLSNDANQRAAMRVRKP